MQDIYDCTVQYIIENQNKFYRLAYSYVKEEQAALDVIQNAICRALEGCLPSQGVRPHSSPTTAALFFRQSTLHPAPQRSALRQGSAHFPSAIKKAGKKELLSVS